MFEVKGVIIDLKPIKGVSKKGTDFSITEVLLEYTEDGYENQLHLSCWGELPDFQVGMNVVVQFNIKTNQYKEKYFTQLTLHDIHKVDAPKKETPPTPTKNDYEDIPF